MVDGPGTDETGSPPDPEDDPGGEVTLEYDNAAAQLAAEDEAESSPSRPVTRTGPDAGATEAMPRSQVAGVGRRLGDFTLEKKVGQGGMGEVYRARQISLDRTVAVKLLPRALATTPGFIDRFQREAKAAANIIHPNVIQIYAYGIEDGTPYFAMEFVEGEDLQQRMRRMRRLSLEETVDTTLSVASALAVAHEKGVVHRDVKPSNVMIDKQGNVKVMDFGLAKAASTGTELTHSGVILGTPNYISPEQGRGDQLDGRADLYSLGVMFYELLTGSLPFTSDSAAGLIFKHVYEPPEPPTKKNPDLPPFLEEICLKLLAKDPADRYPDGKTLVEDLRGFLANEEHYLAGGARLESGRRGRGTSSSGKVVALQHVEDTTVEDGAGSEDSDALTVTIPQEEKRKKPRGSIGNNVTEEMTPIPPPQEAQFREKRSGVSVLFVLLAMVGAGGAGFYGYTQWRDSQQGGGAGVEAALVSLVLGAGEIGFPGVTSCTIQPIGKATVVALKPGEPAKLAPGNYELSVERRGYKRIQKLVTLQDDGTGKARMILSETATPFALASAYEPTPELKDAYANGEAAFAKGELKIALELFRLARDTDPDFGNPSAQKRYDETKKALDEASKSQTNDAQAFKEADELKAKKSWRELAKRSEPRKADPTWAALLEVAQTHVKESEQAQGDAESALARGDFADAQAKLKQIDENDPESPKREALRSSIASSEEERKKALAAAQGALGGMEVAPLEQAKAALEKYLEHASRDEPARSQLSQVATRLEEARNASSEGPLVEAIGKEDWALAASLLAKIEKASPSHPKLKEWREKIEDGERVVLVRKAVESLDAVLPSSADSPAKALELLDPKGERYAEEEKAFRGLKAAGARIVSSRHKDLKVELKPSADRKSFAALVRSTWDLEVEVEGEKLRVSREHVLSLAGDREWKFTRFALKEE